MPIIRSFLIYVGVTFWVILGYNRKARALLKALLKTQRDKGSAPRRIAETISELVLLGFPDADERSEDNQLIREALALLKSTGETETSRVAALLAALGRNEAKGDNAAAALDAYERALQILEANWGGPCLLIDVLRSLAQLYEQMGGNVDRAKELRSRADKLADEYERSLRMAVSSSLWYHTGPP